MKTRKDSFIYTHKEAFQMYLESIYPNQHVVYYLESITNNELSFIVSKVKGPSSDYKVVNLGINDIPKVTKQLRKLKLEKIGFK